MSIRSKVYKVADQYSIKNHLRYVEDIYERSDDRYMYENGIRFLTISMSCPDQTTKFIKRKIHTSYYTLPSFMFFHKMSLFSSPESVFTYIKEQQQTNTIVDIAIYTNSIFNKVGN